ncbi:uncharacterized protein LOC132198845 [Neocloeon triangulifer]|uniref:uncharacterized protein LOC132198845 n=1 Tax=Neocloeon triangulifer TaxID=2078957 RepID=UPI00286ECC91|nr:uncharacterized protein LOC132198845 [Neocloeon triangulifer]
MPFSEQIDDPPLKHLFDVSVGDGLEQEGVIRLTAGAPGPSLLHACSELFTKAWSHTMEKFQDVNVFQYGIAPGSWEFREVLSKFLSESYHDKVNRSDLILTCGATHGLQIILNTLLTPGGMIFVESATYMIALDVFKEFPNSSVEPIEMDDNGLDVGDLEKKLQMWRNVKSWNTSEEKPFWAMLYCIPAFQNPTGTNLSRKRCSQLIELARKFEVLVLCDDVYNLLAHDNPPKRLFAYDRPQVQSFGGHVISNGTFSKILAPGVRVGWLEAPPRFVERLKKSGILRSSGSVNHFMSAVITSIIELGLQKQHLELLKNTFKDRIISMMEVLSTNLPPNCKFHKSEGGYYVWLELPCGIDASDFCDFSLKNFGATAHPGKYFSANRTNCMRLAVAYHEKAELTKAAELICKALHVYLADQKNQ